jgi:hypothetical protein
MAEKYIVYMCPVGGKFCRCPGACSFPNLGCTDDYYSRQPTIIEVVKKGPVTNTETPQEKTDIS